MAKINWKKERGTSMRHAMELCIRYAKDTHNLSVDHIADLMGEASHFTLYKWLESGRMPAIKIRTFEHACRCDYVTYYLACSANKLVINMPTGRKAEHKELNELSIFSHTVIAQLISFWEGKEEQEIVIQSITLLIEDLAHQRGNLAKQQQPELNLEAPE
jgi:hypothetical protein